MILSRIIKIKTKCAVGALLEPYHVLSRRQSLRKIDE